MMWTLVVYVLLLLSGQIAADTDFAAERQLGSKTGQGSGDLIAGGINELVKKKEVKPPSNEDREEVEEPEFDDRPPRTATGGVINTLLVALSFLAFGGNLLFLVHVFYLKEKVVPLKLVHSEERAHQL